MTAPTLERSGMVAVLCMGLSASIIAFVDTIAKSLTAEASPLFLVAARYAIGALLGVVIFRSPRRAWSAFHHARVLHLSRAMLLVGAMVCFYSAISVLPVATALGGYFTGPIVAAVLSVMFLGERTSTAKVAAIGIGFAGTLFILQPGTGSGASAGTLLALVSGILSGVYLVVTRTASINVQAEDNVVIQSFVGAAVVLPLAMTDLPALGLPEIGLVAAMGVLSFLAHGLFLVALRTLEVGTVAPLAYLEIAWAAVLGWALFGGLPGRLTWIGIGCVVTSGLLIAQIARARKVAPQDQHFGRQHAPRADPAATRSNGVQKSTIM